MIIHKKKFMILWILTLLGSIPLIYFKLYQYLLFTGVVFIFSFILWIISIIYSKDENKVYDSNVKEILKTFDSILIKINEIPDLDSKNIIKVESIEDLIDAQVELRKPIYYYKDINSCTFLLMADKEICIYVLRKNSNVLAVIDGILQAETTRKRLKEERERKSLESYHKDSSILDNIDNTTIIKFNNKTFRVSPIRNKEIPKTE